MSTAAGAPGTPPRAVFRVSPLVVLVAVAVAFCATPFASAAPYLWLVYLVPVAMIVWTLRVRTVADAEGLAVRRVVGGRRVGWPEINAVRLGGRRRSTGVSAVLADGAELALPAVHVRDLPRLAAVSGGRLPDPDAER